MSRFELQLASTTTSIEVSRRNSTQGTPSGPLTNPFATPTSQISLALPESQKSRFPGLQNGAQYPRQRKYKTARFNKDGTYEKPWTAEKNPRRKWERIIFAGGLALGFIVGAFICFNAYKSVTNSEYCLMLEDDFKILDPNIWTHETQRGGFGTGSFDWTTTDPRNAYVDAEGLHIVPTLTTDTTKITPADIYDGYQLNLTNCHGSDWRSCGIRSNKTSGDIVNPVRSARLTTKGKKSMRYGKVEVVAKMPIGSWLWPAIWMMPEDSVYGPWPASGEIDIAESKGNFGDIYPDGRDSVSSTLHWGPLPEADAFWRTSGKHNLRRADYSQEFHTYGLEWGPDYLFTYIDTRLLQVLFFKFNKHGGLWNYGQFGQSLINHSTLYDPWSQTDRANTPFDQDFYLILNLAIGSTNGYFPDGVGGKPWGDGSPIAPKEFWDSRDQWLDTWGEGDTKGLTVKSVKMYSLGACGSKQP